jgi:hypothetical protein
LVHCNFIVRKKQDAEYVATLCTNNISSMIHIKYESLQALDAWREALSKAKKEAITKGLHISSLMCYNCVCA